MKRFIGAVLFYLVALTANAQYEISGHVNLENKKEPVASATVTLVKNDKIIANTITDGEGYYQFRKLKKNGTYQLLINHISTYPKEASVNVTASVTIVDVAMAGQTYYLEPLEVTSLKASAKSAFAGVSIAKYQRHSGLDNPGQDFPFLLNQLQNVVINSDAGNGIGYTAFRVRGSDATQINVTINGIPFNDPESQATYFVDVPDLASSMNDATLQYGVGTSTNGAGAFGASLNISTNQNIRLPYGSIDNSYGSFNTWKNMVKAGTGLMQGGFTIDARLSRISSDGYIERAASNLKSFYISAAYISARSTLRFNIFSGEEKTYQAWNGVPESMLQTHRNYNSAGTEKPGAPYDNESDNYQQTHYQLLFNHKLLDKLSFNTGLFLVRGKGYYEQYKAVVAFSDYGLPNPVLGNDTLTGTDIIRQLWLDNKFYGQIFSAKYKTSKDEITIGGAWNNYDGKHFGKVIWAGAGISKDYRWYDLKAKKTEVSAYAKWEHTLLENFFTQADNVYVYADVQYRKVDYRMDGFRNNPTLFVNRDFSFINPKAGISYEYKSVLAYLSYALGNKEPNRDDFEAGETLQPKHETLHDFEAGIKKRRGKVTYGANGYFMLYKNQLIATGQINDVGAYTRANVPNSHRLGIELTGETTLLYKINIAANLALSKNKITEVREFVDDYDNGGQVLLSHNNTDISFSPSVVGGVTATFNPVKNLDLSFISKYVGRQYLDNTQVINRSLHPYYVQDAKCSYTLNNKFFKQIQFLIAAYNLFNKNYEPNGYTYSYISGGGTTTENYYFPMAGFNFMAGFNIKL